MGKARDQWEDKENHLAKLRSQLAACRIEVQQAQNRHQRQSDVEVALQEKISQVDAERSALVSEVLEERDKLQENEERERLLHQKVNEAAGLGRGTDEEWRAPTDEDHHQGLTDIAMPSPCPSRSSRPSLETSQERERLAEEAKSVGWQTLHEREKQRLQDAQAAVQKAQSELAEMKESHESECSAAEKLKASMLEKQFVVDKNKRDMETEIDETQEKTEELQEKQGILEREAKALQLSLGNAMYSVGKKDREIQLKEGELREVRYSIQMIQEEMDEVNQQLQAQCDRVQRVEGSLRLSRDLGSKVQTMRDMLKESHSALSQLCSLVERERSQREQCSQGLRQQQMRTELLLQLLHHFKNRTQDLAPQGFLSQAAEMLQSPKVMSREAETLSAYEKQSPFEPRSVGLPAVAPAAYSRGRY